MARKRRAGRARLETAVAAVALATASAPERPSAAAPTAIELPAPRTSGAMPLEQVLRERRSVRDLDGQPLALEQIGQLAWAAQGITDPVQGLRAAPSAGALYPLEMLLVLPDGVFRYEPRGHRLTRVLDGDARPALARAAHDQESVREASVDLVLVGVEARTHAKYGDRAARYVAMEAGHAAQNVLLQAHALGLGAVPIGAFDDAALTAVLRLRPGEAPLYVLAIGHPLAK